MKQENIRRGRDRKGKKRENDNSLEGTTLSDVIEKSNVIEYYPCCYQSEPFID